MIKLPRQNEDGEYYLSFSQKTTWYKTGTHRDYIRQYFFGEESSNQGLNNYADMGKKVGEALENNDFSEFTPEEQKFLESLPRYDEFEREVKLQFDGFVLKGHIDSNTKPLKTKGVKKILDYKTLELDKKEKYESEEYDQIDVYCAALEQEFGHLPQEAIVVLIDREGNGFKGEELRLTCKKDVVVRDINKERVEQVKEIYQSTGEEISEYYKVFLKLNLVV